MFSDILPDTGPRPGPPTLTGEGLNFDELILNPSDATIPSEFQEILPSLSTPQLGRDMKGNVGIVKGFVGPGRNGQPLMTS